MAKATEPIYDEISFRKVMLYWQEKGHVRNFTLLSVLYLTALRVSDAICLRWSDFFSDGLLCTMRKYIFLNEQKTGKRRQIDVTGELRQILLAFQAELTRAGETITPDDYVFVGNARSPHISRSQVYRIVVKAGASASLRVSPHSLRKTFGFFAKEHNRHLRYPADIWAFQSSDHHTVYQRPGG